MIDPAHQISESINLRQLTAVDDPAKSGFIDCYIKVFAGAPYFECYQRGWVKLHVLLPHIDHCVLVLEEDDLVVGLACCHGVLEDTEPKVRDYLLSQTLPFPPRTTVFMSELAVRESHRRRGLGGKLIKARLDWAADNGYTHFAMRTAASGSNSERMYLRFGANRCDFVQDVSEDGIQTQSTSRIYLWGEVTLRERL